MYCNSHLCVGARARERRGVRLRSCVLYWMIKGKPVVLARERGVEKLWRAKGIGIAGERVRGGSTGERETGEKEEYGGERGKQQNDLGAANNKLYARIREHFKLSRTHVRPNASFSGWNVPRLYPRCRYSRPLGCYRRVPREDTRITSWTRAVPRRSWRTLPVVVTATRSALRAILVGNRGWKIGEAWTLDVVMVFDFLRLKESKLRHQMEDRSVPVSYRHRPTFILLSSYSSFPFLFEFHLAGGTVLEPWQLDDLCILSSTRGEMWRGEVFNVFVDSFLRDVKGRICKVDASVKYLIPVHWYA